MAKIDFDHYAEDYEKILNKQRGFFESDGDYFAAYKVGTTKRLLLHPPRTILEFGCGIGSNLRHLISEFPSARISGCDISAKSLELASAHCPEAELFLFQSGILSTKEPFELIFVANVFHHIPPSDRHRILLELRSALAHHGELVIFEQNPFNPVTRHLVKTCPFDADAQLIMPKMLRQLLTDAGFMTTKVRYTLFFPAFLSCLRSLEKYMEALPLGGQYVVHATAIERLVTPV